MSDASKAGSLTVRLVYMIRTEQLIDDVAMTVHDWLRGGLQTDSLRSTTRACGRCPSLPLLATLTPLSLLNLA